VEGRARGHNAPGAEPVGAPKSPKNVASTIFNTDHLLPKDLRFEHVGAKLVSFQPITARITFRIIDEARLATSYLHEAGLVQSSGLVRNAFSAVAVEINA